MSLAIARSAPSSTLRGPRRLDVRYPRRILLSTWSASQAFNGGFTSASTGTLTGLTYTTTVKSTTAAATPSALAATQYTAFASTVSGAAIMGYGTTNDVALMNRAGTVCLGVGPNTTAVNIPGALVLKDGTAGAPSWVFVSDTTTGLYRSSSGVIGFAISGGGAATLSGTAFTLGSGVALSAQSVTVASGQTLTLTGATVTGLTAASVATGTFPGVYTVTGALTLTAGIAGPLTVTVAASAGFNVGANGATNPVLNVNSNTASVATGISIVGAAAGAGVSIAAISSGTNENLTIDSKGSGTVTVNATGTGAIILTRATTISAALTYGGVTLSNAVTGTGNMVLSASPTFTGTITAAILNTSGLITAAAGITAAGVRSTSNPAYASGTGVELQHDGTTGIVVSFDRGGSAYKALVLDGLSHTIKVSGASVATVSAATFAITSTTTAVQALTATTATMSGQVQATVVGGGTAAGLYVNSTAAALALRESDAAADNRTWDLIANGTTLSVRAVDDANSVATNLLSFARSGTTAGMATFGAGITATTGTFSGAVAGATQYVATSAGLFGFSNRGVLKAPSDGVWTLLDDAQTAFSRLQFGGTTSSFPSIKRNGTAINFRLADDSAGCGITCTTLTTSGNTLLASGGALGFFGAGPATVQTVSSATVTAASLATALAQYGLILVTA